MNESKLHIPFSSPLNPQDNESQTFGCRQNNPSICAKNGIPEICAFARADFVCKKPSRAWKKKYYELKEKADEQIR